MHQRAGVYDRRSANRAPDAVVRVCLVVSTRIPSKNLYSVQQPKSSSSKHECHSTTHNDLESGV